ncbi:MAG: putative 2OG-Fe(II) oxygenase [Xanthobacteraceae bacterium]
MSVTSMPPDDAYSQLERLLGAIAGRPEAAELYYQLAEAYWRARDKLGYAHCFRRAFLLKPTTGITSSRECPDEELRERARALIDHGAGYAAVIAALAVAESRLGHGAEVKYLMDYDRFVQHAEISLPKGTSIDDFNRVLASEIRADKSDSRFHDSPPGRAIRHAWRIELFPHPKTPALKALLGTLRSHAAHYIGCLPHEPAHPFIRCRPAEFTMDGWAIVSNGTGYHESHIHPGVWAVGVYYVVQPEISREAGSHRGWLRIAAPPHVAESDTQSWHSRMIEPVPGSLVLMPAYFWHETVPVGVDQERISIAFEIRPRESAVP